MIERVTLTGIDEESKTDALIRLHARFPFVELAVLAGSEETVRMPPSKWREHWSRLAAEDGVDTAVHLCGRPARTAAAGSRETANIARGFGRIQVNLPADKRAKAIPRLRSLSQELMRPVVVQANERFEDAPGANTPGIQLLADRSGGRGISGAGW